MVKKQRRHSEHDMTKRTLDSIKGERNDSDDQEDGDVDVDDFDEDEERGVSPPMQTENVPPPPTASAAALTTRQVLHDSLSVHRMVSAPFVDNLFWLHFFRK